MMRVAGFFQRPHVRAGRSGRSGWHTAGNAVVVTYLVTAAAWMVGGGPGRAPGWLLVHLLLLGAVTNAIVTWTGHFAAALLQQPQSSRRAMASRLVSLNVAVLAVLSGVDEGWLPVAVAGAGLLVAVISVHGFVLWRAVHAGRGRRLVPTVRFYVAAAVALLLGVTAGTALVVGVPSQWYPRLYEVHVHLNLLGWVTLTVLGTEFSLWPTALRTRMVDGLERGARWSLPGCSAGLALVVIGLMTATRPVTVAGLILYLAGVGVFLDPFVRTALSRTPSSPATGMLAASTGWLLIALGADAVAVLRSADPAWLAGQFAALVPWFLTGFVVQVLLGALSYLLPVVLGGPPAVGRRTAAVLNRWGLVRVLGLNAGVLLLALPVPAVAPLGWGLVAAAVTGFAALAITTVVIRRNAP
jgi:nitrite reductase (NO-forming)